MSLPERTVTAKAEGRKNPLPTAGRAPDPQGQQGKAPRKAHLHPEEEAEMFQTTACVETECGCQRHPNTRQAQGEAGIKA